MQSSLFGLFVFNIVCVCISMIFLYRMLGASSKYTKNPGDSPVQNAQKLIILKTIVTLVVIGIIAAIVNVLFV